jgi:DNA-binding NtrC family response regulator
VKTRLVLRSISMAHHERSLTVLVVDDEALLRWSIAEMLRRSAHAVIEAASAGEARAALATSARMDVVLLDYHLPDSRDLRLLDEIRQRRPPTAVVLMTAFGTPELERRALADGAYCVLNKPFDLLGIEAVIRQACLAARVRGL